MTTTHLYEGLGTWLALGALVFIWIGYFTVDEPPPRGWWKEFAYWTVTGFVVVCWPLIVAIFVLDRLSRRRKG